MIVLLDYLAGLHDDLDDPPRQRAGNIAGAGGAGGADAGAGAPGPSAISTVTS